MNFRQLRTVVSFLTQGSFAAIGDKIGLSPSAVSIQMLRLEEEIGVTLFDRSTRPPTLTVEGMAIAEVAREILKLEERIRLIAKGQHIASAITIGFVPTTLVFVLPCVVGQLRQTYPDLQINIKSGMSGELAAGVMRREIDFALITAPLYEMPELSIREIVREPLFAVGPRSFDDVKSDADLLTALPFISFNKSTWLGQTIAIDLQARGIYQREGMEVDSLETIEMLVSQGYGVSVLPQRLMAPPMSERLKRLPFGQPPQSRRLVVIEHANNRNTELEATVRRVFQSLPDP